jgi:hypothetical protein
MIPETRGDGGSFSGRKNKRKPLSVWAGGCHPCRKFNREPVEEAPDWWPAHQIWPLEVRLRDVENVCHLSASVY